jgi:starvation-inducible outer membrane lipoprotein
MRQPTATRLLCTLLLSGFMLAALPVGGVQAQQGKPGQKQSGLTAQEAAARAQSRFGGKVLKVTRSGGGYKVKLLQDSGKVVTVTIRD